MVPALGVCSKTSQIFVFVFYQIYTNCFSYNSNANTLLQIITNVIIRSSIH